MCDGMVYKIEERDTKTENKTNKKIVKNGKGKAD